jgi:GWxTD domain-containing protein
MNLLTHWTQTPAARALGWTLFHFLWEGLAIAAVLAIVLFFVRGSRPRYAAACVALALMLAACAGTFIRVIPQQPSIGRAAVKLQRRVPAGQAIVPSAPAFRPEDLLPWAAAVWLGGVLLLHIRTLAGWMSVYRLRQSGVCAAPPLWQERLSELAAGVGLSKPVALLESVRVDVPVVIGYLRPAILVPLGLLAGMPADHLEAILLHELAHIRRRDYLVNLLQTVAENLLFYHPAVWWISGVIRAERENCCDDLVVAVRGNAHRYAVALTALETRRVTGEPALAATGGDLMKRIHRLLDHSEPPHAALTPAFSAGLILVTAAVALAAWQPNPQEQLRAKVRIAVASPYQKWLTEDVAYIIEERERAAFKALQSDPEREKFIEQFWVRRDPTPGTTANEFKMEHYRRIAYANEKYVTVSGLPGWKTDRGRIYITYGPADEIESHPTGNAGKAYPYEQWRYRHLQGIGDNVDVEFTDENHAGEFRMTSDPRTHPAEKAVVSRDALWPDTVRRGDMRRQVRGLGLLSDDGSIQVKFAAFALSDLKLGQLATVDLRAGLASGRVATINGSAVTLQLDAPTAAGPIGRQVDATVDIETLRDVVFVGRPAMAAPNSDGVLFKLEPDGQHAIQTPVRFGRASVNVIEVVSGLVPGDRVILSDMTAYQRFNRVEIQ